MSFAPHELRRLLNPRQDQAGVVVAIEKKGTYRIATERGATTARSLDDLKPGDRVIISQGIAYKAPAARATYLV